MAMRIVLFCKIRNTGLGSMGLLLVWNVLTCFPRLGRVRWWEGGLYWRGVGMILKTTKRASNSLHYDITYILENWALKRIPAEVW